MHEPRGHRPSFRHIKRVTTIGPLNHLVLKTIQSLPQWGDFTTAQWGGGALFDLGVHPLAIAVLVGRAAGAGEVVALSATLRGEITDTHAEVHLRFESGLTATVTSSWEGEAVPTWDIEASSNEGVVRAELFPHLTLEHNGDEVALPATTAAIPMIEQFGYVGQLSAFIADLEEGTQPFMDVAFGRWIMEMWKEFGTYDTFIARCFNIPSGDGLTLPTRCHCGCQAALKT